MVYAARARDGGVHLKNMAKILILHGRLQIKGNYTSQLPNYVSLKRMIRLERKKRNLWSRLRECLG